MDLKHPTTKIPHHESEPTPHSQPIKLLTFPNGKTHHHQTPPHATHTAVAVYKECLKNHAVGIGGHALDGCGEFMPSPTYTPTEPSSLKCAACGCHRNFHRRAPTQPTQFINSPHQTSTPTTSLSPASPANAEPTNYAFGQHLLLSLGTGTATDQNHTVATPETPVGVKVSGRKRFRTKFSPEQKQKMLDFAEKVGWKMQRCDDKMVADFCNEIGIRRRIFKVWMHNNKNISAKREKDNATVSATTVVAPTAAVGASLVGSNDSHQENGSSSSSGSLSEKVLYNSFPQK